MKRTAVCLLVLALLGFLGVGTTQAEEKAATSRLPAALQALQVDNSDILSTEQASAIRGQGTPFYYVEGWIFVNNAVARGTFYMRSYQPMMVNVVLLPRQFAVRAFPY